MRVSPTMKPKVIWHWEKDGEYSVRSAYYLLCSINCRSQPSSSNPNMHNLWKETWKAPVPSKVRNFMWRLAKNTLPTRANISKKGIYLDTSCPLCNEACETTEHMIRHCSIMKLTLFASNFGTRVNYNIDVVAWSKKTLMLWLGCFIGLHVRNPWDLNCSVFYFGNYGMQGIKWCLRTQLLILSK